MNFFCTTPSFFFLSTLLHFAQNEEDKYLITLVYRFVFANEAICGDPFMDPDWLPAAEQCFVNCDPTVHMCMIHTRTHVQKCRLFSRECQAAIRKHLGWSSTIVSVYRPAEITTPMPAFITAQPEPNADRSAVEAAESIERDLMGIASASPLPPPDNGQSSKEASVSDEVITRSPNTNTDWFEPPPIEENGYSSADESPGLITESPQNNGYDGAAEQPSEYDGGGLNNNNIESDQDEQGSETAQEDIGYGPVTIAPKNRLIKIIPPEKPMPSPPAFPPYYLKNHNPRPITILQPSQPEPDIVPKYINFLELPDDNDVMDLSSNEPQPPGFRPLLPEEENFDEETKLQNNVPGKLFEEPEATTWSNPLLIRTLRPFPALKEFPKGDGMEIPMSSMSNGARFEVLPPYQPLRHAVKVGTFDKSLITLPEQRRIHHYTDSNSRHKITAEVQPDKARDHSSRCCEWSLNGLCDSHWQRIRQICPKSCGTLLCEDIEGIKSCTRVVDVDVEDCFQSARLTRYFGLKNAETDEEKRIVIDGIIEQKFGRIATKRKAQKKRHKH